MEGIIVRPTTTTEGGLLGIVSCFWESYLGTRCRRREIDSLLDTLCRTLRRRLAGIKDLPQVGG